MHPNTHYQIHRFGGPDVLSHDRTSVPLAYGAQAVIRVHAASVNPVDFKIRSGEYPSATEDDLPIAMGRDISGVVEQAGPESPFSEGDAVFAIIGNGRGGYAERVLIEAEEGASKPHGISHVEAAAVPLAALTAWQGLFEHGGLERGQRVLIHGAAGGVGHFAVQFAKHACAFVAVTASGRDRDFLASLGVDQFIDYKAEQFEHLVSDIDLVFDLIAGEVQEQSWSVLKRGGALVSTLSPPSQKKADSKDAVGINFLVQPNAGQLTKIAGLIEEGAVHPHVMKRFPLAEAADAQRALEEDHTVGKIVLVAIDD